MENDKEQTELERLRAEVELLRMGASPTVAAVARTGESDAINVQSESDEDEEKDVNSQIEDLLEALEKELENTSPMTLLIVFALGILVGRLLPR